MSKEFKAGDLVYCPHIGKQIFKLEDRVDNIAYKVDYPLGIIYHDDYDGINKFISFTLNGFESKCYKTPQIFPATPKNHVLLELIYGVELEAPPAKPTSHEIIAAMLGRGDKSVHCWVSDTVKVPSSNSTARKVHYIEDDTVTYYVDTNGNTWFFATPFNPRTNKAITKLPK